MNFLATLLVVEFLLVFEFVQVYSLKFSKSTEWREESCHRLLWVKVRCHYNRQMLKIDFENSFSVRPIGKSSILNASLRWRYILKRVATILCVIADILFFSQRFMRHRICIFRIRCSNLFELLWWKGGGAAGGGAAGAREESERREDREGKGGKRVGEKAERGGETAARAVGTTHGSAEETIFYDRRESRGFLAALRVRCADCSISPYEIITCITRVGLRAVFYIHNQGPVMFDLYLITGLRLE